MGKLVVVVSSDPSSLTHTIPTLSDYGLNQKLFTNLWSWPFINDVVTAAVGALELSLAL
jgi:hypothetical protein